MQFLTSTLQYAPGLAMIIAPLAIKYSDYPGAKELYAEIEGKMKEMKQNGGEIG